LDQDWLVAALLLIRLNLDPLAESIDRLYSDSPRGRPPFDPILMLRALLLMTIVHQSCIDLFVRLIICEGESSEPTAGLTFYVSMRSDTSLMTPAPRICYTKSSIVAMKRGRSS